MNIYSTRRIATVSQIFSARRAWPLNPRTWLLVARVWLRRSLILLAWALLSKGGSIGRLSGAGASVGFVSRPLDGGAVWPQCWRCALWAVSVALGEVVSWCIL